MKSYLKEEIMSVEERNILIQNLNFKLFIARSIICEDYGLELDEHGEVNMDTVQDTDAVEDVSYNVGIIKTVMEVKQLIGA